MNPETEADIVRALGRIASNGHLVKGYKPVYWSVVGASALAEAEVEYQDKQSFGIDVRFAAADRDDVLAGFGQPAASQALPVSVVIWTTTPWTLPSNQAVCLHGELDYALVKCALDGTPELLILAADMVDDVMLRYGVDQYETIAKARGSSLEHKRLQHPFVEDRQVPLILGEHVTTDAGTGAVHTAPDHGLDDFYVGLKYGIGTLNLLDEHGVFTAGAGQFAGDHVYKVDEKVIAVLEQLRALIAQQTIHHSYAHCWRTKTPLIYRATPQWFISMTEKICWAPRWRRSKGLNGYPTGARHGSN